MTSVTCKLSYEFHFTMAQNIIYYTNNIQKHFEVLKVNDVESKIIY